MHFGRPLGRPTIPSATASPPGSCAWATPSRPAATALDCIPLSYRIRAGAGGTPPPHKSLLMPPPAPPADAVEREGEAW